MLSNPFFLVFQIVRPLKELSNYQNPERGLEPNQRFLVHNHHHLCFNSNTYQARLP
jgi:hypothetical protein